MKKNYHTFRLVLLRSCSDHYITLKYFFEKKYCSMTGITPRPELPLVTLACIYPYSPKLAECRKVQPGGSSRALCVMARATLVKFAKNGITFNYQRKPAHPLINEILTYSQSTCKNTSFEARQLPGTQC